MITNTYEFQNVLFSIALFIILIMSYYLQKITIKDYKKIVPGASDRNNSIFCIALTSILSVLYMVITGYAEIKMPPENPVLVISFSPAFIFITTMLVGCFYGSIVAALGNVLGWFIVPGGTFLMTFTFGISLTPIIIYILWLLYLRYGKYLRIFSIVFLIILSINGLSFSLLHILKIMDVFPQMKLWFSYILMFISLGAIILVVSILVIHKLYFSKDYLERDEMKILQKHPLYLSKDIWLIILGLIGYYVVVSFIFDPIALYTLYGISYQNIYEPRLATSLISISVNTMVSYSLLEILKISKYNFIFKRKDIDANIYAKKDSEKILITDRFRGILNTIGGQNHQRISIKERIREILRKTEEKYVSSKIEQNIKNEEKRKKQSPEWSFGQSIVEDSKKQNKNISSINDKALSDNGKVYDNFTMYGEQNEKNNNFNKQENNNNVNDLQNIHGNNIKLKTDKINDDNDLFDNKNKEKTFDHRKNRDKLLNNDKYKLYNPIKDRNHKYSFSDKSISDREELLKKINENKENNNKMYEKRENLLNTSHKSKSNNNIENKTTFNNLKTKNDALNKSEEIRKKIEDIRKKIRNNTYFNTSKINHNTFENKNDADNKVNISKNLNIKSKINVNNNYNSDNILKEYKKHKHSEFTSDKPINKNSLNIENSNKQSSNSNIKNQMNDIKSKINDKLSDDNDKNKDNSNNSSNKL